LKAREFATVVTEINTMSNNISRQPKDEGYVSESGDATGDVNNAGNVTQVSSNSEHGQSKYVAPSVTVSMHSRPVAHPSTVAGINGDNMNAQQHANGFTHKSDLHQTDVPRLQAADNLSIDLSWNSANGGNVGSLQQPFQNPQLHNQLPEVAVQSRHAHIPSISQIRKESLPEESLPASRPPYNRALSSQIPESIAPKLAPEEAHAEALRRLGKAEHTVKTLKRRGSNESLSSLISYSIRRPSVSARPESGYSLDALAHVLEDAAQEGNLALAQAIMALGANPNFRSVNRLKNRRHDALNKATAAGHVEIIDFLLRQGATFNLGDSAKKDPFEPIDYKLLDVSYSGYTDVARYLIANQGANPFVEQWPREYFDANRTVYRRVASARVSQRTVLDAIARMGSVEQDLPLLKIIMNDPKFDATAICSRTYSDTPYSGDGTRMLQTTSHYSALSTFVKAGWSSAVEHMLVSPQDPSLYQKPDITTSEQGQIPSTTVQRYIYPSNSLTKHTWLHRPQDALAILTLLCAQGFDISTPQHTPDDSAPRSPLARCILANAAAGVDILLKTQPDLVNTDITFRLLLASGVEQEYIARSLAASIVQGSLDCARVLLAHGASVNEPAFGYANALLLAAGWGVSDILPAMIPLVAPQMACEALELAIRKMRVRAVEVLIRAGAAEGAKVWDAVLGCADTRRDGEVEVRYRRMLDMVYAASGHQRPSSEAMRRAVEGDNVVGIERCLGWGYVERNEVGKWCQAMDKRGEWSELLDRFGKY
jgi:hypothetical protein